MEKQKTKKKRTATSFTAALSEKWTTQHLYNEYQQEHRLNTHNRNKCCICKPQLIAEENPLRAAYRIIQNLIKIMVGDKEGYIGEYIKFHESQHALSYLDEPGTPMETQTPEGLLAAWRKGDPSALKAIGDSIMLADLIIDTAFDEQPHDRIIDQPNENDQTARQDKGSPETDIWFYDGLHRFEHQIITDKTAESYSAIARLDMLYDKSPFHQLSKKSRQHAASLKNTDRALDRMEELQERAYRIAIEPIFENPRDTALWIAKNNPTIDPEDLSDIEDNADPELINNDLVPHCTQAAHEAAKYMVSEATITDHKDEEHFRESLKAGILQNYPENLRPIIYHYAWYRYVDTTLGSMKALDWTADQDMGKETAPNPRPPLYVEPDHSWPAKNFSIPGRPGEALITPDADIDAKDNVLIYFELYPNEEEGETNRNLATTAALLAVPNNQMKEIIDLYRLNRDAVIAVRGLAGMNMGISPVNIMTLPTEPDTEEEQAEKDTTPDLQKYSAQLVLMQCGWCQAPSLTVTLNPKKPGDKLPTLSCRHLHLPEIFEGKSSIVVDQATISLSNKKINDELNYGIASELSQKNIDNAIKRAKKRTFDSRCMVEMENYKQMFLIYDARMKANIAARAIAMKSHANKKQRT